MKMEPRLARGFERLAINLENHIRHYVPGGWVVPISNVAHVPLFGEADARVFMQAHREDSLDSRLTDLSKDSRQLEPWYVREAIKDFFEKRLYESYKGELMNTARIGVVGYCPPTRFDEQKALEFLADAYDKVISDFPEHQITIFAGVTNVGVLKLAYEEAKRRGWKTGGIGCKKAYDFEWFPTDEKPIIVGENWGDESPVFIHGINAIEDTEKAKEYSNHPHYGLDVIVRIGMGPQSVRETKIMKEMGKPAYEYDLPKLE